MEKPPLSIRNSEDDGILVAEKNSRTPFGARATLARDSESRVGTVSTVPCSAAEGLATASIFARCKHDPLHDRVIPVFAKPLIFM